jgi:AAA family ATP:ADP antiporter
LLTTCAVPNPPHPVNPRLRVVGLFLFFLFIIAAFWIQKPIRTSRFLAALGPQQLPWVKLGTALLILPVVLLYSSLAARYRREHIVYACTALFVVCSLIFWSVFTADVAAWTHYVYFFYVDIFNSVMVAVFWSFANDISSPGEARRDYGFIGAGGIVGGALGSGVTGWSVEHLGAANLLLICAALLIAAAAMAWLVARHSKPQPEMATRREAPLRDALNGARLTLQSRYLTAIAVLVISYEIVSNIIDYQFNTFVAHRYPDQQVMAAFLGRFNTASIAASAVVQVVLTTWILRRWGPRVGLFLLPCALALGSGAFLLVPVFATVAAAFFADATLSYSLNQASKEVLYTPTDEATKYQAKAFIDMFLMRLGKGLSAILILVWTAWLFPNSVQQLAIISVAVTAVWLLVARAAAAEFARRAEQGSGTPRDPAIASAAAPRATDAAAAERGSAAELRPISRMANT